MELNLTQHSAFGLNGFQLTRLIEMIESKTGNFFNNARLGIIERVFTQRITELKLNSAEEYLTFLSLIPQYHMEWKTLISMITNNESYFFREFHHFEALEETIRNDYLGENPGSIIRVLSAACSEGQEAYSMAIILNELKSSFPAFDFQIYAMDIDEKALAKAREGCYNKYSFREQRGDVFFKKYFSSVGENFMISPSIKGKVNFLHGNLINPTQLSMLPSFDIIFCRNVLIYFRENNFNLAINNLFNLLKPGGYLFLGHSESALGVNPMLSPVSFNSFIGYKRIV